MNKKQIFTIPNVLSCLRIILIPFILWAFFSGAVYWTAGLIILSGLTDVVDGFIARHFNMVSPLGKALDPIADKLTLLAIIISLCVFSPVVFIILIMFLIKETILGIEGLIIIKKTGTTYSAQWHGKVTTFFLYFTMLVHVVWTNIPDAWSATLLIICDVLMLMTLTLYTIRNVKALHALKQSTTTEVSAWKKTGGWLLLICYYWPRWLPPCSCVLTASNGTCKFWATCVASLLLLVP